MPKTVGENLRAGKANSSRGLARAQNHVGPVAGALMLQGDTAGGRQAYQDFFAQWSEADTDIPVLRQAKVEYGRSK
jgi:hypothetical protein